MPTTPAPAPRAFRCAYFPHAAPGSWPSVGEASQPGQPGVPDAPALDDATRNLLHRAHAAARARRFDAAGEVAL